MAAVRHEIGRRIHRCLLVVIDELPARFERMYINLGLALGYSFTIAGAPNWIGCEGHLGSIWRSRWKAGDGSVCGELLLVRTVVIHRPDFFTATAVGNKIDLGADEALCAEVLQDVGGEFARHFLSAIFIDGAYIDLSDQLRRSCVRLTDVVEPSVENQLIVLRGGIAECEIVRVG